MNSTFSCNTYVLFLSSLSMTNKTHSYCKTYLFFVQTNLHNNSEVQICLIRYEVTLSSCYTLIVFALTLFYMIGNSVPVFNLRIIYISFKVKHNIICRSSVLKIGKVIILKGGLKYLPFPT